ncbi:major facilitator superfamily domain-containing protein [Aspergillus floccosus]
MAGLVMLAVSTALLCVGTTLGLWVAGRLFQGASGAIVWSVGCALIVDTVEPERIGQALGYVALGMTLGVMAGPLLGGVIYEHGGYYAVFGLAFALVGLDICFRLIMIEKKYAARWLPPSQANLSSTQEDQAPQNSFPEPSQRETQSRASYGEKIPDQPTQDAVSAQKRRPALLTLLSSARLIVALWAYFIMSMIISSFDTVLPLFVHDTFGWQQTAQGLIFIAIAVPNFLEPVTGYINDKYEKSRRFLAAGALLSSVPAIVCLRFVTENTIAQKVLLCALLAVVGVCLATFIPPVLAEVSYIVQKKEQENPNVFGSRGATALAYGVMNGAYATGLLVAPFLAGFIRDSVGWDTMTWALALFPGVSSIPVLLVLGGFPFSPERTIC